MMPYQTIGLIGAMDEEIRLLLESMEEVQTSNTAGITYHEGRIGEKKVVLCKSGVGKVNAAVCTQVLIDHYHVDAVVFTGVAGALDPELEIGDIVVSKACMQHDMDVTPLGFARGIIPFQETSIFPADSVLVELALQVSRRLFDGKAREGLILSGDQFVADRELVKLLHEQLGGTCTEMEGSAVAQVCHMNGLPYVVIRSMSDKADGSAHVNFPEFTQLASKHSYQIVEGMLRTFH